MKNLTISRTLPSHLHRRSVSHLPLQSLEITRMAVHVGFVVDKVSWEVFLRRHSTASVPLLMFSWRYVILATGRFVVTSLYQSPIATDSVSHLGYALPEVYKHNLLSGNPEHYGHIRPHIFPLSERRICFMFAVSSPVHCICPVRTVYRV